MAASRNGVYGTGFLPIMSFGNLCAAFAFVVAAYFLSETRRRLRRAPLVDNNYNQTRNVSVPFIVYSAPDWNILHKSNEAYRRESHQALEHLSVALEALANDEENFPSVRSIANLLQNKIDRLSTIYDKNLHVMVKSFLIPFPTIRTLPSPMETKHQRIEPTTSRGSKNNSDNGHIFISGAKSRRILRDEQPYDSGRQVVAHAVRDWSVDGVNIRSALYEWCIFQMKAYPPDHIGPLLVPGAGLGRLAWELADRLPYSVEAMESSVAMAAAAFSILNRYPESELEYEFHPYAADPFSNEVDSSNRLKAVMIPDVDPLRIRPSQGSLSYTVGMFGPSTMLDNHNHYSAVLTCFFLDTANTVYDYVSTIADILGTDALWINVGPVQWHQNSQVPLAVDELRQLLELYCLPSSDTPLFEILHWRIDEKPIDYRNDRTLKSTYFDGYCPLRFVLRKRRS